MKFQLESRVFELDGENNALFNYLSKYCTFENNKLYIDINYISELRPILDGISEDFYNGCGWKSNEILIDFEYNIITLRDGYIE